MFSSRSGWSNRIGLLVALACALAVISARFELAVTPAALATTLYSWALLLGAFALLLGVLNALWYHLLRVQRGQKEWLLSLLLLVAFALVFGAGVTSPQGSAAPLAEWVFDAVLAPGQATLYALTGFFLLTAAFHYLRITRPGGLWLVAGALLMLLVQTPASHQLMPEALVGLFDWLLNWPITAAMRGVLLGGVLGLLLISIRLILRSAN